MVDIVPWTGVDLDGSIAVYDHWRGPAHIGAPIPKMVARVKAMLSRGEKVKIFTARANRDGRPLDECLQVEEAIKTWCQKHLGAVLEITCKKDFAMVSLFDDRCIQLIPNTGERADGVED